MNTYAGLIEDILKVIGWKIGEHPLAVTLVIRLEVNKLPVIEARILIPGEVDTFVDHVYEINPGPRLVRIYAEADHAPSIKPDA